MVSKDTHTCIHMIHLPTHEQYERWLTYHTLRDCMLAFINHVMYGNVLHQIMCDVQRSHVAIAIDVSLHTMVDYMYYIMP